MTTPKAVMSGMRPTGRLHLGHYLGVLKNWLHLQQEHPCFWMIADLHALTTQADHTEHLAEHTIEMMLDWLAAGVDPARATVYVQSHVPQISELHVLLSMVTPVKWVETDPTLKDMVAMLRSGEAESEHAYSYGLLGYPILQTSDILAMRGALVPVGKDQLAHLEISRDIARRFNHQFSVALFDEPRPLLTDIPVLKGLDGRKMGKSYGNAIFLADTEDETLKKIKTAITDPARMKRTDPGDPEACEVVYDYYEIFASPESLTLAADECRRAARGCVDCKKLLAEMVNESLRPLRAQRAMFAQDRAQVEQLLMAGAEKARDVAADTLRQARQAMRLYAG